MDDLNRDIDGNFFQLVLSLQVAAMQQMGKIASPITGKVERNLEQSKASIDMLEMLAEKTEGNLSKHEKDLIDRVLYEARMNFLDESKKPAEEAKKPEQSEPEEDLQKEEKEGKEDYGDQDKDRGTDEGKPAE